MSVTTVLVPVLEPEAEGLLESAADERRSAELLARAEQLRRRVARIDAVREDLHEQLFHRWAGARAPAPSFLAKAQRFLGRRAPVAPSLGYDPFVHLFGRSLPVFGKDSAAVAQRLQQLLAADDDAFRLGLVGELKQLDIRAGETLAQAAERPVTGLREAIAQERQAIESALAARPPHLRAAYDALVRLSAWSWPVWRLDGEMLSDLLHTVGATVLPDSATSLFEELGRARPEVAERARELPKQIGDFATAGGYLKSSDVKLLAGSLRLGRGRMAQNAQDSGESAAIVLRNLRLLEEAVFFCEAEDLGLAEAAGVEWHEAGRR